MRRSNRSCSTARAFELFNEVWLVQITGPLGQNCVQMTYPIIGFVCQMPLLKRNRRRLLLSLWTFCTFAVRGDFRDLTQPDNWKIQEARMTKKCHARPGMHSLARHFFVTLPAVLLRKVPIYSRWKTISNVGFAVHGSLKDINSRWKAVYSVRCTF